MNHTAKKEKGLILATIALAIICLALVSALLFRKKTVVVNTADGKSISYSVEEAEKNANILINSSREILSSSPYAGKKLYVIGHKCPDLDTVGSAIAYARLLNALGFDAEPRITMAPNGQTRFALEYCKIPFPEMLKDAADQNIILVDVSDYVSSVDGLENANLVGVIDHHALNLHTNQPVIIETAYTGATQTIVGMNYLRNGIIPDEQTAKLMALTIIGDTSGLNPDSTTEADRMILDWAAEIGKVNVDEMIPQIIAAKDDYSGMTPSEIYYSDFKAYVAGNDAYRYMIGIAKVNTKEELKEMALRLKSVIDEDYEASGMDMMIAQVYLSDFSAMYLAVSGPDADYIIQGALGDRITLDKDTGLYYAEPSLNRKKDISPRINEFVLK